MKHSSSKDKILEAMNTRDILAADLYGKGWRNNKRNEEIAKGNRMFALANAFRQNVLLKIASKTSFAIVALTRRGYEAMRKPAWY